MPPILGNFTEGKKRLNRIAEWMAWMIVPGQQVGKYEVLHEAG
jgi:hypothetical protein